MLHVHASTSLHKRNFDTRTISKEQNIRPPPPSQSKVRYVKGGKPRPEGMECDVKKCEIRRALKASPIQGQPHELPPPHPTPVPFSSSPIPLKQRHFSLFPLLWREAVNNQFFPQKFSVLGS